MDQLLKGIQPSLDKMSALKSHVGYVFSQPQLNDTAMSNVNGEKPLFCEVSSMFSMLLNA